jgi:hypothetical protein
MTQSDRMREVIFVAQIGRKKIAIHNNWSATAEAAARRLVFLSETIWSGVSSRFDLHQRSAVSNG